jgi:Family of unknown function (DUF6580)
MPVLSKKNSENYSLMYRMLIVVCFILFAAVVRIVPHPWNFTPVGAMALFSGAKLGRSWKAFLLPLAALFLGDLFVGFHRLMPIVYFSFCLSVLIGIAFRNRQSLKPLSLATFVGALQFFVVTNFGVWAMENSYPHSYAGLVTCYIAGVPFFGNTLVGDAVYATLLFGGFALLERLVPGLSRNPSATPAGYSD